MKREESNLLLIKINDIYLKQITVYNNVLKLTEEQRLLYNENADKESVLKLINDRLKLINSLDKSNAELNVLKNSLIDILSIKEFRINLIKEKINLSIVDELCDTLSTLGKTIHKINTLDNEIRQFYKSEERIENITVTSNPQKVHQAYKVFLDGNSKDKK